MNKIIAIVGQAGSGKDTAANYTADKYKFKHISTADILRDYIISHNLGNLTRENMSRNIEILRKEKGNDVLVKMALANNPKGNIVLSALRHPDESKLIISNGGILIDVYADLDSRYDRNLARHREGDEIKKSDFKKIEKRENSGSGFDISKVEKQAKYRVENNGSYDDFYAQIDLIMKDLLKS